MPSLRDRYSCSRQLHIRFPHPRRGICHRPPTNPDNRNPKTRGSIPTFRYTRGRTPRHRGRRASRGRRRASGGGGGRALLPGGREAGAGQEGGGGHAVHDEVRAVGRARDPREAAVLFRVGRRSEAGAMLSAQAIVGGAFLQLYSYFPSSICLRRVIIHYGSEKRARARVSAFL